MLVVSTISFAQDSTKVNSKKREKPKKEARSFENHSPKKAALLSTILPGAGQVYNRKNWFWKVPIIYGGLGTLTYFAVTNNKFYIQSRDAFNSWNGTPVTIDGVSITTESRLKAFKDSYRRNRDFSYFMMAGLYALQILDANIEAHLIDFRVDENLLLSLRPHLEPTTTSTSFGLSLTLKHKR